MSDPAHLSYAEAMAQISPVSHTDHHPGQPLESQADADAQVDDLQLREGDAAVPTEYAGLHTSHPELNYASRSNIVVPENLLPIVAVEG